MEPQLNAAMRQVIRENPCVGVCLGVRVFVRIFVRLC